MKKVIEIEYTIDGLGHQEYTKLNGISEGENFNIGKKYNATLEKINSDSITLKFNNSDDLFLQEDNTLELKIGIETKLLLTLKPAPTIQIKLLNINEVEDLAFI